MATGMSLGTMVDIGTYAATAILGIYAIVMWRREKKPILAGIGIAIDRKTLGDFIIGAIIASAAIGAIFLIERYLGAIRVTPATPAWPMLALYAAVLLVFALKDEILTRGLLLSGLARLLKGRYMTATVITAILFGLIHASNHGATPLSILSNALGGLIYGLAFVRTQRIWAPLGLHFAWNFVQGPVLGFILSGSNLGGLQHIADLGPVWLTGGDYGPEGGVVGVAFRFVLIAAVLIWTGMAYKAGQPRVEAKPAAA